MTCASSRTPLRRQTIARRAPDPVPALLYGRLAVDRCRSGLGIDTALAVTLRPPPMLNAKAACRTSVTALNTDGRRWLETVL